MVSQALIDAYHATNYRVQLPDGERWFRANEPASELNEFVAKSGAKSWIFITAYNPYSNPLSQAENETRQRLLKEILSVMGYEFYLGEGVGDSGEWPPEPSLFVIGMSRQKGLALGQVFEQNAIMMCEIDGLPEIVLCEK